MKKIISVIIFISFIQHEINAQDQYGSGHDPYLPARHKINAGIYTTYRGPSIAAPVVIGEVTYGVTNRFSTSILGGTTGTLGLVGIRFAASLYEHKNFRLLSRLSIIYYPERRGTFLFDRTNQNVAPWILSMGFLDGEWKFKNGVRLSAGMGFLETHCYEGMMSRIFSYKADPEKVMMLEMFNTIQTSVSIPLSRRLMLRPETIVVFKGTQLVPGEGYKVGPLNIYLNLVYNF